jgi:ribonuclease P protein component
LGIVPQYDYETGSRVKRAFRLRRSIDFKRVRRSGKSYAHPLIVLITESAEQGGIRVGISASHSVGNAVCRNRAKRRLRAAIGELLPDLKTNADLIFLARKAILDASYEDLCKAVSEVTIRAGLLKKS